MAGTLGGLLVVLLGSWGSAAAVERVRFDQEGQSRQVVGRLLAEAADGGVLIKAPDGVIWPIPGEDIRERITEEVPFEPLTRAELARQVLQQLPPGFEVFETSRYLILYNTSRGYAQWCGALFERLHLGFTNYWTRRGFELSEPEFPLVAIVFADRRAFLAHARGELGDAAEAVIGYYNLQTNHMTMFDLTGVESLAPARRGRRGTSAVVNEILSRPEAEQLVATIVHEATHQLAFNCGLHARLSDCPLWVSEGIAMFFETPDPGTTWGWRTIGAVNRPRLIRLHEYAHRRPHDSLTTLIRDDRRFRDPATSLDAYAEAWGLTHFLLRRRPQQYVEYLRILSEKKPLYQDGPERRIEEFVGVFGDLDRLEQDFRRHIAGIR